MPTVTIGDNTGDDFTGTEDTSLRENNATTNYGTSTIYSGTWGATGVDDKNPLIAFSGISSLPSALTVSSASINLYLIASAGGAADNVNNFHRCLRNWVEAQATWNIYSTGNNWTTAGGLSDGNDRSATLSGTMTVNKTTGYHSVSTAQIAADVEDFADGTYSNYGWVDDATSTSGNVHREFDHSGGTDGQRPYLNVTYTETGGYTLTADPGSYTYTGQDANLLVGRLITAETGAYSYTGQDANLLRGLLISAEAGIYSITGNDANLLLDRLLSAETGVYNYVGIDATLTYTPASGYILTADPGNYSISGINADLLYDRKLIAEPGVYSVSGVDAGLFLGRYISAETGNYTLTGQDAGFLRDYRIVAEAGIYTYTGFDVNLAYSGRTGPDEPGLEYTLIDGRFHYTLDDDRIHYTFEHE